MDKKKLQRHRSLLVTCGSGYILFGVLELIQVITLFLYGDLNGIALHSDELSQKTMNIILIVALIVTALVSLMLRLYIGSRAIREGHGMNTKHGYLIVCVIIVSIVVLHVIFTFVQSSVSELLRDRISSLLSEISTIVILLQIIRSSTLVGRYSALSESDP